MLLADKKVSILMVDKVVVPLNPQPMAIMMVDEVVVPLTPTHFPFYA